jgi:hypothetical protein
MGLSQGTDHRLQSGHLIAGLPDTWVPHRRPVATRSCARCRLARGATPRAIAEVLARHAHQPDPRRSRFAAPLLHGPARCVQLHAVTPSRKAVALRQRLQHTRPPTHEGQRERLRLRAALQEMGFNFVTVERSVRPPSWADCLSGSLECRPEQQGVAQRLATNEKAPKAPRYRGIKPALRPPQSRRKSNWSWRCTLRACTNTYGVKSRFDELPGNESRARLFRPSGGRRAPLRAQSDHRAGKRCSISVSVCAVSLTTRWEIIGSFAK